jgi:hypothetical protein
MTVDDQKRAAWGEALDQVEKIEAAVEKRSPLALAAVPEACAKIRAAFEALTDRTYAGRCDECSCVLLDGDEIVLDAEEPRGWCAECAKDLGIETEDEGDV